VEEMMDTVQDTLTDLKNLFNNAPDLVSAIKKHIDDNAELKKQLDEFKAQKVGEYKAKMIENAKNVNGVKVISGVLPVDAQGAKDMAFQLRAQFAENLLVVIGGVAGDKPSLTVAFSDDLVKDGKNAGKIVREAAKLIQGGGGGQAHFATAGGKNTEGLKSAVDKVIELAEL
jgi:alanyl-tRNA synthetase